MVGRAAGGVTEIDRRQLRGREKTRYSAQIPDMSLVGNDAFTGVMNDEKSPVSFAIVVTAPRDSRRRIPGGEQTSGE